MCERCEISDAGENMKIVILSCALGAHFARLSCCSDQRRRPHNKVGLGKQTLRPSRDHWKSICMGCFWIHVSTPNSCLATPINLKPRLTYFNTRSICKVTLAPCLAKLHGNKHIVFSAKSCSLPQWNKIWLVISNCTLKPCATFFSPMACWCLKQENFQNSES